MAGAMRKMAVYLGLVEPVDDPYAYDDQAFDGPEFDGRDDDGREVDGYGAPARPQPVPATVGSAVEPVSAGASVAHLADRRPASRRAALASISMTVPRTYNDARQIGESFRDGVPVIMNLADMDDDDAKRLVDFAAGLTFGLHGKLDRIASKVFLLSPANVTIDAEDRARLVSGEFYNQS
jgi:cell division inhibitor SepF